MLDFAPQNLSEYDRELLQNRFDIRSWFGHIAPLLRKQTKPLDPDIQEFIKFLEQSMYENAKPVAFVEPVNLEVCCT